MINNVIYSTVGEKINIFFQWDGYTTTPPLITKIIKPDLSLESGFPIYMNYISNNLFNFEYIIPYNINYVGTVLINIKYDINDLNKIYQIIIKPPFGLSGNNILNPVT